VKRQMAPFICPTPSNNGDTVTPSSTPRPTSDRLTARRSTPVRRKTFVNNGKQWLVAPRSRVRLAGIARFEDTPASRIQNPHVAVQSDDEETGGQALDNLTAQSL